MTSNALKLKVNLISLQINYLKLYWCCQSDSEFIWGNISIFHKLPLTDIVVGSQPLTQTEVQYRITASVTDKLHIIRQLFLFLSLSPLIFSDHGGLWRSSEVLGTSGSRLHWLWEPGFEPVSDSGKKNKIVLFVGRITQTCGQELKNSSPPVQFKNIIHVLFMPPPV